MAQPTVSDRIDTLTEHSPEAYAYIVGTLCGMSDPTVRKALAAAVSAAEYRAERLARRAVSA